MNSVVEFPDGDRVLFTNKKSVLSTRQMLIQDLKIEEDSVLFAIKEKKVCILPEE